MINSKTMKLFTKEVLTRLRGDWAVIGGTILPLMGIDHRITIDIDMVKIGGDQSDNESLRLMEIAEQLGLPPETINQAGGYFLSKIKDYESNLILVNESDKCRIFRPNAYLYIDLKSERLSQSDLDDCKVFLENNHSEVLLHSKKILSKLEQKQLKMTPEQDERLQKLIKLLKKLQ